MTRSSIAARAGALAAILLVAACTDVPTSMAPPDDVLAARGGQDFAAAAVTEVMALQGTIFGGHDPDAGILVFGVENDGAARGVRNALTRLGIPATAYDIQVTEPIHFMSTLRSEIRPVVSGLQIHWSGYVCTLGFSVDHAGGRSFITNSHCTEKQGTTGNTQYNQPSRSISPGPIGFEAHDPPYTKDDCSVGKVCRDSDAARVLYEPGIESQARIAKTDGLNTGSLTIAGHFSITGQDNTNTHFSGTMYKVGRTTGWTSGTVSNTCVRVNVAGSNIQLRCQTMVSSSQQIVAGGDSGSPVFTGNGNVTLRGILWGGSSSGDRFVFSPLKNIQDELGSMNATTDGVGGVDPGDPGDDDPPPPDEEEGGPNCPPNSNNPRCR
jgi:hypothetical protein